MAWREGLGILWACLKWGKQQGVKGQKTQTIKEAVYWTEQDCLSAHHGFLTWTSDIVFSSMFR